MRLARTTAMGAAAAVLLAGAALAQQQQPPAALRGGGGGSAATGLPGNTSDERLVAELQQFFAEVGADGGVRAASMYDKQQQQGGNQYSTSLAPLLEIYMDPRGVADRSPSKHWLFPACGFAAPIIESPVYCPIGLAFERIGETALQMNRGGAIVSERTMYETEKEPAQGAVPLPARLYDVGHPIPFQVTNQTVIEAERHTYYWVRRCMCWVAGVWYVLDVRRNRDGVGSHHSTHTLHMRPPTAVHTQHCELLLVRETLHRRRLRPRTAAALCAQRLVRTRSRPSVAVDGFMSNHTTTTAANKKTKPGTTAASSSRRASSRTGTRPSASPSCGATTSC